MLKWKRMAASLLAGIMMMTAVAGQVIAADGYYDRAVDDNNQQLYLLRADQMQEQIVMITINDTERQTLCNAAQSITAGCTTDEQKVKAIYTWITQNLYYDWDGVNSGNLSKGDPYSAYQTRITVCEGYATLFAELLNAVGIPCVALHGASIQDPLGIRRDEASSWNAAQYDEIDHAWNAAYVNGKWLYYDTTWDCGNQKRDGKLLVGRATTDYYAISADDISANHRTAYRINDESGYRIINGSWVYCDQAGNPMNGPVYDGYNMALYYMENGRPLTGNAIADFQYVQFDSQGRYVRNLYDYTGWVSYRDEWYYVVGGITCYGWGYLGGKWYYLDPETSVMRTGWQLIDGRWYYLSSSGAMQTGWFWDGENWYYLNPSGTMATGWVKTSGEWYYLSSSGAMQTGWLWDGKNWYYLDNSGEMCVGWWKLGGKWYYFSMSGEMAHDTSVDGYWLGSDGAMYE